MWYVVTAFEYPTFLCHAAPVCGLEPTGTLDEVGGWVWGTDECWGGGSAAWGSVWGGASGDQNTWSGGAYRPCAPGTFKPWPGEACCT